jgi:hypothetical protein
VAIQRPNGDGAGVVARSGGAVLVQTEAVTITTTCNHTQGWDQIAEIQFQISNDGERIFLARYVAAEDKVYVENPDAPGTYLDGERPGSGAAVETRHVSLLVPRMSIAGHGSGGAALDVNWVLSFKELEWGEQYIQSINIIYASPGQQRSDEGIAAETSFFQVGQFAVGDRTFLPIVGR